MAFAGFRKEPMDGFFFRPDYTPFRNKPGYQPGRSHIKTIVQGSGALGGQNKRFGVPVFILAREGGDFFLCSLFYRNIRAIFQIPVDSR